MIHISKNSGVIVYPFLCIICLMLIPHTAISEDFNSTIPMRDKGASTFYVNGNITGYGEVEFMVDTGSGYMTINEQTLAILLHEGQAKYVKELEGILANGTHMVVPVYLLSAVNIGGECELKNVEAAVFPGKTRLILGLSALTKASPFIFSVAPSELVLSNCQTASLNTGSR